MQLSNLGHKCPDKTASPVACPKGTYQDETQQVTCKEVSTPNLCHSIYQIVFLVLLAISYTFHEHGN